MGLHISDLDIHVKIFVIIWIHNRPDYDIFNSDRQ